MQNASIQFEKALEFVEGIDALKSTYRQCLIMSGERAESTAEHTFSFAMAVMAFANFSNQEIDVMKAVKMALFHDLAEALTGDVFHYDKVGVAESSVIIEAQEEPIAQEPQALSESDALLKLLLPIAGSALHAEIYSLWNEFETGVTPEAIFVRGLDRFLPMFHNYKTRGHSWVKHGITKEQALRKNAHIEQSSLLMWDFTKRMLDKSQSKGWIL